MPTRFLSDAELARLTGWPAGIDATDLVAFFTPSPDDVRWLHRHAGTRRTGSGWLFSCVPCRGSAGCPTS